MASTATYLLAVIVVAMAAVGGYIAVYDFDPASSRIIALTSYTASAFRPS